MVQAVLFDYGLVLSGPADPRAWTEMQQILGIDEARLHSAYWAPREDYDRGTLSGPAYWREVANIAEATIDDPQVDELIAADTLYWTTVNQPMVAWAARLQAAETPTGILSNLGDAMTAGVLGRQRWLHAFPHRIFSHTLGMVKPDIALYRHAAATMQLAPGSILFVDDRETNCDGALTAGMQAIRYSGHDAFVAELERRGLGELWRSGRP